MATRPDITIKPNQDNDLIALLNEQAGFSTVSAGTVLVVQNKSDNFAYVQESNQPTVNFTSGKELQRSWQYETNANAPGVRVTCGGTECVVGVEVL
tara:strand:- start:173 stop:460 length:288 start_codon:yes stop_codon:yes gene_type:complete